jgi:hypothetical protein
MIIMEIAPENFPQMRFSENDNVVEAIATYGTDQSFTERILPRAPRRRYDFLDANRLNPFLMSSQCINLIQVIRIWTPINCEKYGGCPRSPAAIRVTAAAPRVNPD